MVPMTDALPDPALALGEQALPIGAILSGGQFKITGHLGAGGFGITYKAVDNVLGRNIVIKECFPSDLCVRNGHDVVARNAGFAASFRSVVGMFMREARSLAKLRHPNIVGVHGAFEQNDTAYMVLDLIEGKDLFEILESTDPPLSPGRVKDILLQLLDAIEKVHELDLLHRDISPDNIIIEKSGTPVLIDFGAARGDASRHTRAISSLLIVKDGYSPQEFYVAGSRQDPSSDLYGLAATFYHVVSGEAPVNSQTRLIELAGRKPDPCVPLAGRIDGYDADFLQAIDTAMQIHPADRLQSAGKWRSLIEAVTDDMRASARVTSQDVSLELEMSLTQLVEETNDEVRRISHSPVEAKPVVEEPARTTSKPEWVEEFNRDTEAFEADPDTDGSAPDQAEMIPTPDPEVAAEKTLSETDWVGRAARKQAKVVDESEVAFGITEPTETEPPSQSEKVADPSPDPDTSNAGALAALRQAAVFLVLLVGFCFLFFFEIPQ